MGYVEVVSTAACTDFEPFSQCLRPTFFSSALCMNYAYISKYLYNVSFIPFYVCDVRGIHVKFFHNCDILVRSPMVFHGGVNVVPINCFLCGSCC